MKILFFHRWVGVHSGGTETHLKELAKRLAKKGHKIDILTREGGELRNWPSAIKIWRVSKNWRESDHSYEDLRVYWHTALFMIKSFFKLWWLHRQKKKYDVISVHFVTEALVARLFRALFKIPYIFVLEGYTPLEARVAKSANLQIAISNYEKEQCFKGYHYFPTTIYVGVDRNRFNNSQEKPAVKKKYCPNGEKLVLTVCRLEPRKDIPTLLWAASQVNSMSSQVKFVIVGDGILREETEKMVKKMNLTSFITCAGYVPDKDLPSYYRACDLFVLPSLEEGFGIVLAEAMASGAPIVATKVGAVPEVLGDCGLLIPPKNAKILAGKILNVLSDEKLQKEMSRKSLERAKRYDWNKLIIDYEKVYQSVIKN